MDVVLGQVGCVSGNSAVVGIVMEDDQTVVGRGGSDDEVHGRGTVMLPGLGHTVLHRADPAPRVSRRAVRVSGTRPSTTARSARPESPTGATRTTVVPTGWYAAGALSSSLLSSTRRVAGPSHPLPVSALEDRETSMAVDPSGAALAALRAHAPDEPVVMLNLLRFAASAADGCPEETTPGPRTGSGTFGQEVSRGRTHAAGRASAAGGCPEETACRPSRRRSLGQAPGDGGNSASGWSARGQTLPPGHREGTARTGRRTHRHAGPPEARLVLRGRPSPEETGPAHRPTQVRRTAGGGGGAS